MRAVRSTCTVKSSMFHTRYTLHRGRRARLVCALHSDWHGLVPATLSPQYGSDRKPTKVLRMSPCCEPVAAREWEGAARGAKRDGRRARLVCALNSHRYGLVPPAYSRVCIGQEAKSAQNGPVKSPVQTFTYTFTPSLAVRIQALVRSLAAMSDRIPVRAVPESA